MRGVSVASTSSDNSRKPPSAITKPPSGTGRSNKSSSQPAHLSSSSNHKPAKRPRTEMASVSEVEVEEGGSGDDDGMEPLTSGINTLVKTNSGTDPETSGLSGKGKRRADPIDLDDPGFNEGDKRRNGKAKASSASNGRSTDMESVNALKKELEELNTRFTAVEKERDTYQTQLQELHSLRMTEPEKLAKEMERVYKARMQADEKFIQELRLEAGLVSSENDKKDKGKKKSREAELEEENIKLRDDLQRMKKLAPENEQNVIQIRELQTQLQQVNADLQAEIAHNSDNNTRTTANNQGSRVLGSASKAGSGAPSLPPGHAKVIKLYEELSRLSVIDYKAEESEYKGAGVTAENDIFSCIVTAGERSCVFPLFLARVANSERGIELGLAFKLKYFLSPTPSPNSPSQRISRHFQTLISYTPTSIEYETDKELLASLEFLKEPFQFDPEQLHVFLRSMVDRVSGEGVEVSEEEEQESS